jgi:hypothetical protein
MTTQLVLASTAFGLTTVVAAKRAGLLRPADRHVLVCSNNSAVPEVAGALLEVAGAAALAADFDAVLDLNDALAPLHPAAWAPRESELPVWHRYLRRHWDLTDPVDLLVESIQVDPALALCRVFADARVDVYADGLMSYGPTRVALPDAVGARAERVLHLDLVPGLVPLLLREFDVDVQLVPTDAFTAVVGRPTADADRAAGTGVALLLGQYLSAGGVLSAAEEAGLHADMLRGAVVAGHRRLEFKPHPSAPVGQAAGLQAVAAELGVELAVRGGDELAEARFARGGIALVVGCFSTALATARFYGLPTATVGTDLLLERLTPYENSNRGPVTIVRATVRDLEALAGCADHRPPPASELDLSDLVGCVAYCMQPRRNPDLRPTAVRVLREHPDELRPYVKRRRLNSLELPGGGSRRVLRPTLSRLLSRSPRPARPARP